MQCSRHPQQRAGEKCGLDRPAQTLHGESGITKPRIRVFLMVSLRVLADDVRGGPKEYGDGGKQWQRSSSLTMCQTT